MRAGPRTSGSETYKFTGKPVSQTTGLYYEYQRWYDPSIGRFISQDSLAGAASDPQSLNPYVYVENNPTNNVDPTGQFLVEALIGAGIGAGIGYFGCVWATGGWTSSACGEAALAGAAVGALAGLTYGASLAFAGGTLGLGTATASGGFAFSGASGLAAFAFAGATSGAVAGAAQYFASGGITLANGGSWQFNAAEFGESVGKGALLGAALSVAGYGAGKAIGSLLDDTRWPANAQEMEDLLGKPGTSIPDTADTPGRGQMIWEIRSEPRMRIVGEQHPYDPEMSPASQAWHWHVDAGHYWGYPGARMPGWLVRVLAKEGYL